jgi:hypothetical protein
MERENALVPMSMEHHVHGNKGVQSGVTHDPNREDCPAGAWIDEIGKKTVAVILISHQNIGE